MYTPPCLLDLVFVLGHNNEWTDACLHWRARVGFVVHGWGTHPLLVLRKRTYVYMGVYIHLHISIFLSVRFYIQLYIGIPALTYS